MSKSKKTILIYSILGLFAIIAAAVFQIMFNPTTQINDNKDEKQKVLETTVMGNTAFSTFNSGAGLSSVIETASGKIIVIDTGSGSNPFLQDYIQGREIELLCITNWDAEHTGALEAVINASKINRAYVAPGDTASPLYASGMEKLKALGITVSIPEIDTAHLVDDVQIQIVDNTNDNLALLAVHGQNRLLFQGNQTPEAARDMINRQAMKNLSLTGIVLARNGQNEYLSKDLMKHPPKFVLINMTANEASNKDTIQHMKEHNIDVYTFVASPAVPLHFSSSGKDMIFIGFE